MTSIIPSTYLNAADSLPLTCTRAGTCCHGKAVWLNPWELACIASAKGLAPRVFRDQYCEFGGIRLRFDGSAGWKGLAACSQYVAVHGCSVHGGRPLSCRLYPLGRERRGEELRYLHRDAQFPCLEGCPEVVGLPQLTVAEYLAGQAVHTGEAAQDAYLEVMQELADGAFALLLESGLAASGDRLTLRRWREFGKAAPEVLVMRLGSEWIDRLMLPEIGVGVNDPVTFTRKHHDSLQATAQAAFGTLETIGALREASSLMMGLALHLGRGLGANPVELVKRWIATAKEHGARD